MCEKGKKEVCRAFSMSLGVSELLGIKLSLDVGRIQRILENKICSWVQVQARWNVYLKVGGNS